jgi:hypothetical protein
MRRSGNSIAVRFSIAILVAACGLTGCGGEGSNPKDVTIIAADETGMLRKLRSASELEGLLKNARPGKQNPAAALLLQVGAVAPPQDVPYAGPL